MTLAFESAPLYSGAPEKLIMSATVETRHRSLEDPEGFWGEVAEGIDWISRWDRVLDSSNPPFYRWFPGAQINTCYNALDRHVEKRGNQAALIYDSAVTHQRRTYTYRQLRDDVARFAGALASQGVTKGDRVSAQVRGYYEPDEDGNFLQTLSAWLAGFLNIDGSGGGGEEVLSTQGVPLLSAGLLLVPQVVQPAAGVPTSYLQWVLYDEAEQYLSSSTQMMGAGSAGAWDLLAVELDIPQSGYLQVYVANESGQDVWYDDLEVRHETSRVIQENHYYPFGGNLTGLEMAGDPDHKFQYNGKEKELGLGLGCYDHRLYITRKEPLQCFFLANCLTFRYFRPITRIFRDG